MSKKDFQKTVRQHGGYIFSDGTLNLTHLLPKVYDLLLAYNIRNTELKKAIEDVFCNTDNEEEEKVFPTFNNQYYSRIEIPIEKEEDASYIFNEDVFNFFNDISPSGYYFGSSEGDGACFGWWTIEEEECY